MKKQVIFLALGIFLLFLLSFQFVSASFMDNLGKYMGNSTPGLGFVFEAILLVVVIYLIYGGRKKRKINRETDEHKERKEELP
jgi:hypothetical protein